MDPFAPLRDLQAVLEDTLDDTGGASTRELCEEGAGPAICYIQDLLER